MDYIISEKLAQIILNYLGERPYKEVAGFINQLMQLKRIEKPKEPEE
jgi:hypothetical protein